MRIHGAAVLALVLAALPARAQTPYVKPVQEIVGDRTAPPTALSRPMSASQWLTPPPILGDSEGTSPPIASEIYMESGFAIPVQSCFNNHDLLSQGMNFGWSIKGGLRTLFFDETVTKAWVLDASLSHFSNGHDRNLKYPLRVIEFNAQGIPEFFQFGTPLEPGIVIRHTDRTYGSAGVGRDYFLWGTAEDAGTNLRVGWQVGGRYGTLSQKYDRIKHRTDVIGGVFGGVHGELECPTRFGIFSAGIRTEWGYTWSDILQVASDIQEINVLFTFGMRF